MRALKIFLSMILMVLSVTAVFGLESMLATKEDIATLAQDLLAGKIEVGITRLSDIQSLYGDAANITDSGSKLTYNYGDLKIDFDKKKMWKEWDYDSFKKQAYTSDINKLRSDLEGKKLVGENITYDKVRKDYGEPTESEDITGDGAIAIFYYGNIKLVFENVVVVRGWDGKGLNKTTEEEVILKPAAKPADMPAVTPVAKPAEKPAAKAPDKASAVK